MTTTQAPAEPRPTASRPRAARGRVALLGLGGACLLAGLDAALLAVGVWAPVGATHLPDVHGMVMVLGFMGTLIALERAQALRQPWAYLAPGVLGAGGVALVLGQHLVGQLLLVQGCLLFLAVLLGLWRRAPLPLVAVQALSVVLAAAAAALWLVVDVAALIGLLAGFLVLTIAAERAELAQLAMGRRAVPTLVVLGSWVALAASATVVWPDAGARALGLGLVVVAAWLLRDDVARRMVRADGLRRYNGAALLGGYGWLAVAGLTWLVGGVPATDAAYDIAIHATFLGFGMSMIMAHAPIIFPTVLGRPLPYRPALWLPLVVLNTALAARVVGDLTGRGPLWEVGSVGTVVALLLFVVTAVGVVVRGE
ncbi:hypothetical protein [Propioniciclava sinopodophylli]|uniref:hypothetical protein n=1 Tax=Propioniciclava sinopodophylli TaxID=1837344 RepID=UPI002492C999|nr:hypothetical protein [Propioniciclava sinopodophylli]